MNITRHEIDLARIQRYYDEHVVEVPGFVDAARERRDNLGLLSGWVMATACSAAGIGRPLAEVKSLFRLAAQAYRAMFLVFSTKGQKVTVPIGDGDPVTYKSTINPHPLHPKAWLEAFFLGAVLRDDDLLSALMDTPTDLIRQSCIKGPEFQYLFIDAIRSFIDGWQQWRVRAAGKILMQAMKATEPERPDILDPDRVLLLDVQTIAAMYYLLARSAEFGTQLADAVAKHKEYWTSDERKRLDWEGFVSLPLLGIASLADACVLPFDVESDYIPLPLIRNTV
jgi:hypothetical protein